MQRCTKSKFSIKFPSGILKLFENLLNRRVWFLHFSSSYIRVRAIIKVELFSRFYGIKKFLNSKIWTLRSKEEVCCICVERRRGDHLDVWWKESTSWKSLSQRKTRQWLDGSMLSDISGDEWTKVFTLKLFQAFCQLGNNFLKKKTNNAFETWKPSKWKQA